MGGARPLSGARGRVCGVCESVASGAVVNVVVDGATAKLSGEAIRATSSGATQTDGLPLLWGVPGVIWQAQGSLVGRS